MTGNKIADKITSLGKPKEKAKKVEEIYILSEKRQQIIDDLKNFERIKTEFQEIVNLLDTTSDDKDLPRFVTKNGLKFMINHKKLQCQQRNYDQNTNVKIRPMWF